MTGQIFHPETIAIVNATRELLSERHAALTLRMWHHLHLNPSRDLIFIDRLGGGRPLVAAFLDALTRGGRAAAHRPPLGVRREHLPLLEQAFGQALRDVMGKSSTPMVVRAWREVLHAYLDDLLGRT